LASRRALGRRAAARLDRARRRQPPAAARLRRADRKSRPRHERRDHAAPLPHQSRRHDHPHGHPRPRDGRQDAQARDRARGRAAGPRRAPRGLHLRMSRVRLLFSEAWSSIRMNLSTTIAATMTVLIGMCLLGLFIALGTGVLSWSNHIQKELQVHVYFASDATKAQENAVGARLSHDSRVNTVMFVSKEQALVKMKHDFNDLFRTPLPSNPLPDSYTVVPKKAA